MRKISFYLLFTVTISFYSLHKSRFPSVPFLSCMGKHILYALLFLKWNYTSKDSRFLFAWLSSFFTFVFEIYFLLGNNCRLNSVLFCFFSFRALRIPLHSHTTPIMKLRVSLTDPLGWAEIGRKQRKSLLCSMIRSWQNQDTRKPHNSNYTDF